MNPLFQAAKETMTPEHGVLMGAMSLLFMGIFLGWTWYAYAPSRAERMEAFGNIAFEDGE